jgi:hypothetical protein
MNNINIGDTVKVSVDSGYQQVAGKTGKVIGLNRTDGDCLVKFEGWTGGHNGGFAVSEGVTTSDANDCLYIEFSDLTSVSGEQQQQFPIGTRVVAKDGDVIVSGLAGVVRGHLGGGPAPMVFVQFDTDFFGGHDGHGYMLVDRSIARLPVNRGYYMFAHQLDVEPEPEAKPEPVLSSNAKAQTCRILKHLLSGERITPLIAIGDYGIYRLAARIHELRKQGHKIETTIKYDHNGKQYAEYALRNAGRV